MDEDQADVMAEIRAFVDEQRVLCHWYLREEFQPETVDKALRVLSSIKRYGDLAAFQEAGESYVAGRTALGEATHSSRISRDIDLFHEHGEAVAESWSADRRVIESAGLDVDVMRERPTFVEATVSQTHSSVIVQ